LSSNNTNLHKCFSAVANNPEQEADYLTVKLTANNQNLMILSKFLSDLNSRFKTTYVSRILKNPETSEYYVYVHISINEIADKLQELSPFP
jgi:hypothetical protein